MEELNKPGGTDSTTRLKEYFAKMTKKKKMLIAGISAVIVIFAVAGATYLNANNSEYQVLYRNIDTEEGTAVYQTLKDFGASVQMNDQGEVMVLKSEYDQWLLRLAEKGFPQSALSYDLFSSHSTMTTTEFEKKQWLIYQLQDRIQETLKRIDVVSNAVVTINLPEKSDYVWEQAKNDEKATASALLTLKPMTQIDPIQINAIKTLIAASAPQMKAEDVTIVDAATSLELGSSMGTDGLTSAQNLTFEQTVQTQLENNIVRLLEPRFGKGGVVAVAKVVLNYDKMITESMEMREKPGGGGNVTHTEGSYSLDGAESLGGIVGETDNTDIPTYGYNGPGEGEDVTNSSWSTDLDYSYIKTQVEKGNAILEKASASVMVETEDLTIAEEEELIRLISTSVDIDPGFISLSRFNNAVAQNPIIVDENEAEATSNIRMWVYIAIAAGSLLLIGLIIGLIIKSRKKKVTVVEEEIPIIVPLDPEEEKRRAEEELLAYKKQLAAGFDPNADPKDAAIMVEVKDFARSNPEITASLLRSWLKEDE